MFNGLVRFAGFAVAAAMLTTPAMAQNPIRVGVVLSTAGPVGFIGAAEQKSLELLVDETNKSGGINGRKIELVSYNDNSDPAQANTYVRRLIDSDNVALIIGGTVTPIAMAMIPTIDRARIPYISVGAGLPIVEPVKKCVFKTPHSDRQVAERVLMDMQTRGFKTIGILAETTGFGQSGLKEMTALAPQYGVKVAAVEQFGNTDSDVTPQLTKIRQAENLDALMIMAGAGAAPAVATKGYASIGLKLPLYLPHSVISQEFLNLTAGAAENARMPTSLFVLPETVPADHPQKKVIDAFYNGYRARYGEAPMPFAANTYDAGLIAIDALRRSKTIDSATICEAIEQTKGVVGLQGVFTMSPTDHQGLPVTSLHMFQVKGGKFTLLN